MFTVDEKTTFVGITDLRVHAKKMLNHLKDSRVVITERNTPRAIVLDYSEYEKMRDLIEMAEEGIQAVEIVRRKKRNKGRFLTHEELFKKLAR